MKGAGAQGHPVADRVVRHLGSRLGRRLVRRAWPATPRRRIGRKLKMAKIYTRAVGRLRRSRRCEAGKLHPLDAAPPYDEDGDQEQRAHRRRDGCRAVPSRARSRCRRGARRSGHRHRHLRGDAAGPWLRPRVSRGTPARSPSAAHLRRAPPPPRRAAHRARPRLVRGAAPRRQHPLHALQRRSRTSCTRSPTPSRWSSRAGSST